VTERSHRIDLVDADVVAKVVGLSRSTSLAAYRRRHAGFPAPLMEQPLVWRRSDVEAWAASQRADADR
jgi:predicted DNA-binding transcriptional regulator AlpA